MPQDKNNLHAGHRERMRKKLELYGREVFHTHELLEMLLYHALPYKNTNPIAKNLLLRFSSLDGVFSATREELMSVEGVGPKIADMLISVGKLNALDEALPLRENAERRFDDYLELGDFFVSYFGGRFTYETVLMLLNSRMEYIDCVSVYETDFDSAKVKSAPFIDTAIRANASVAVIAHNHPFGPHFPTPADIATNDMIAGALTRSGILLAEHYVVSGNKFVGFMKNLSTAFSRPNEIERFFESKRKSEKS